MKGWLIAATLAFGSPATAQDRMTAEQCTQSWAALETLMATPETGVTFVPDNEGWCLLENGSINQDNQQSYRLASLRWRASGIDRLIEDGLPPRSLDVIGNGLSIVPQTNDPVFDYLLGVQSTNAAAGFGLSVRWDGVQNAVLLDEAYFDFAPGNRIEITARIDGVDLSDTAAMQSSIGSMGLRDLSLQSDFDGWFETHVALSLGSEVLLGNGIAPEAQVAALKDQAVQFFTQIPATIMPDASRDALSAFVQSLPHPRGTLRMQLSANPPLGAARMAPFALMSDAPSPQQIVDLGLNGVALLFTWTPTGE